ncbi:unnamed protein product, partial [marine sediment metagenome]
PIRVMGVKADFTFGLPTDGTFHLYPFNEPGYVSG